MSDEAVRDEIAFIRRAIEAGRDYAAGRSADLLVWGIAIAIAYFATYARTRGWSSVEPDWVWAICVVGPWIYSLRGTLRRLLGRSCETRQRSAMSMALAMTWFGCGIFLTLLALTTQVASGMTPRWFGAVAAGVMGIGFFVSSFLCNLRWMRFVAIGWWAGEVALYALRDQREMLLLGGVMMLLLLALPGAILLRGRAEADA